MSDERGTRSEGRRPTGGFDDAIDRAVREMLDVEPPVGLRGRVLRRIEARSAPSPFSWKMAWLAVPVAAAAALILALRPPSPSATKSVEPISVARVEPPQPAPTEPVVIAPPEVSQVRPARRRPRADRILGAASYTPAEHAGNAIEPLEAIAPIQVTPIAQHRVATGDIAVRPLNPIADVQIAPLTPPDRRN